MPIGNIAHGVGAALGFLVGIAASNTGVAKWRSFGVAALIVCLGLAGSTVLWPRFNVSREAQMEVERAGVAALDRSDNIKAAKLLDLSAHMRSAPARTWFNLGIAYHRLGNYAAALDAYQHAAAMPDATKDMREAANELDDYQKAKKAYQNFHHR